MKTSSDTIESERMMEVSSPTQKQSKKVFDDDTEDPFETTTDSLQSSLSSSNNRKVLSFSEHLETSSEVPNREEYTLAEKEKLWYRYNDMKHFKHVARVQSGDINFGDATYITKINETYSTAEKLSWRIENEEILATVLRRLDVSQSGLALWCMQPEFRGLEKFCSLRLQRCPEESRDVVSQVVFDSAFLNPTRISQKYLEKSRTARLFARMMGLADYLAAAHVYKDMEEKITI